jgi:hypothetical protein
VFRAFLAALTAATLAIVLGATSVPAAEPGFPTIHVSDTSVRLGAKVVVSGEGPSLREHILELRTRENGWQPIASMRTGVGGQYAFTAPAWEGSHQLRVVAAATLIANEAVSKAVSVTVRMPYRPIGVASDWRWLSHRGARWDPCRPITYRINPAGGYPGATADVRQVFRNVGRVTGFRFKSLGTSRRQVQRLAYGYHPAGTDVLIDWQGPSGERGLARGTAGIGGHWVMDGRRFAGYMILDQTERLPRVVWRQLMTHELGHILGLGHARSQRQLMYGLSTPLNRRWGNGDLAALRRIGPSRGCLPATAGRVSAGADPARIDAA